jgi:hypothetical protein
MPENPRLRASDADRDRVTALLREHHAAGRLTVDEFQERLSAAFAAKTMGELTELMADLPAIDLYQLPDRSIAPRTPGDKRGASAEVARQPLGDAAARTAAVFTAIGLYVVTGVVFHIWWIPWWFIILFVAFRMARRPNRG